MSDDCYDPDAYFKLALNSLYCRCGWSDVEGMNHLCHYERYSWWFPKLRQVIRFGITDVNVAHISTKD